MKVFFIGDIVGRTGRRAVRELLPVIVEKYQPDLVLANAENAAGGFGLTRKVKDELLMYGINCLTMGNHTWDNHDIFNFIDDEERLIRPLNFNPGLPGRGWTILEFAGKRVAVINLIGQLFTGSYNSPFAVFKEYATEIKQSADLMIIDFHAEATGEKLAFANFVDGEAACVLGTHTHIQTADERVLPGGTGYITDLGLTGASDSILGMSREEVIKRFTNGFSSRLKVARGGAQLNGALFTINLESGITEQITRINLYT